MRAATPSGEEPGTDDRDADVGHLLCELLVALGLPVRLAAQPSAALAAAARRARGLVEDREALVAILTHQGPQQPED